MSTKTSTETSSNDLESSDESISLSLAELFYPSFKRLFEGKDFVSDLDRDLGEANINKPAEIYLSTALGYSTILGALLSVLVSIFMWGVLSTVFGAPVVGDVIIPYSETTIGSYFALVINAFQYPLIGFIFGLLTLVITVAASIGFAVYYPKLEKRSRAREIELVLGDSLAFMYSLSVGGTNQLQVMEAVANAEDTYGEVSVEFQRIVYQMKYFNTDYQTAVENVAELTPSDELEGFLSDMLSIINSGGDMTSFLETQQDMMRERGRKKQEELLDTLEFFGEMYMSLNILPMGLIIVLVIVSMMGDPQINALYLTVYAILPALNIMFGIIISSVKKDEIGDGKLDTEGNIAAKGEDETKLTEMSVVDFYSGGEHSSFFAQIQSKEFRYRVKQIFRSPWEFFRLRPKYVLIITLPVTVIVMMVLLASGLMSASPAVMISEPYSQTIMWVYIPVLLNLTPMAVFYEWNRRTRGRITDTLTQDIRKLANTNETGQPILEAMKSSAEGQDTLLSQEFNRMYKKTKFGTSLSPALVEFNNRYQTPRLARVVKLIQKAQEASSNISEVLQTAAKTSRYQDDLEQDRIQRTRMQVAVTTITYLVFLGVIAMLDLYFIGEMLEGVEIDPDNPIGSGFADLNVGIISMLFFHAVTIQALCAGAISGYSQTGEFSSSYKYIVAFMVISAIAWGFVAA